VFSWILEMIFLVPPVGEKYRLCTVFALAIGHHG
jgi:hypothetical protein